MIEHICPNPGAPYADCVVVEDKYLYLSGLTSEDLDTGAAIGGDITTQTRIVLENLKTLLERHGSDMDHVIRCEIVLTDFSERPEMNKEYVKHFDPAHMPSRICYGNVVLSGENKIEILATAIKK
ncbi:MAG: RidA family protein [Lachnospiraceae bacterium]|nr:RidA family protein [Lachnospiraceae bacterium]